MTRPAPVAVWLLTSSPPWRSRSTWLVYAKPRVIRRLGRTMAPSLMPAFTASMSSSLNPKKERDGSAGSTIEVPGKKRCLFWA